MRRIAAAGHEIASHGYGHELVNRIGEARFRADIQYRPSITKNKENTFKLDFQRDITEIPLISRVLFGGQYTTKGSDQYGGGQRVVSNGANLNSTADDITTMTGNVNGALVWDRLSPVVPASPAQNTFANPVNYTKFVDRAAMLALARSALQSTSGGFFSGYNGVSGYPAGWLSPNYAVAAQSFDTSLFNLNNVYKSEGSLLRMCDRNG